MENNEDYVSFETAKILKEKGFDEVCDYRYYETHSGFDMGLDPGYTNSHWEDWYKDLGVRNYSAPTLQMAMKWLRKEKGVAIIPVIASILDNERFLWNIKIVVAKTNETYSQGWIYEEPEEVCEAAIKYCLENLI